MAGKGFLNSQNSQDGKSISTTTPEVDYIFQGKGFQIHRRITVPTTGKKIVIDFSGSAKEISTLPLAMKTNLGQAFVDTYKISSYTGGTEIQPINRNSYSDNVSDTTIKDGITSADVAGDDKREYIVGTLSTNQNEGGGSGGDDNPKILGPIILVIDIDNQESEEIILEINVNWYEI